MMKILIIRNYPSYISVKNNTYNIQEVGLAKALVRRGHCCDIVFWTNETEEELLIPVSKTDDIVRIYYKKGKTLLKNTLFIDCDNLYEQYDILQPCEYNQIESWYLAKKYPQKTVIYHGPYYSKFNRNYNLMCCIFDLFFLNAYRKRKSQFIVKSDLAKRFLEYKGITNINVVGVGIDVEMLTNKARDCEEKFCNSLQNNKKDYKILYIGRFEERRNIPFIFDVVKKINDTIPNVSLYMVGTGKKKYMESCWKYAKKIGIYNKIKWQDKMEQKFLSQIYNLCDCFILPTSYEIFGMVILEAMYYNALVITNTNGGSTTLIKNGQNGIIIDSWDSGEWASIIVDLLKDEKRREQITIKANRTIRELYTWDKLAVEFEKQYLYRLQEIQK